MSAGVRIGLEILSSIVIGLITSFLVKEPFVGLAIGLTTFLILEVLRIGLAVDKIGRSVTILAEVANSFQQPVRNNLDSFFNTLLLSQLRKNRHEIGPNRVRIPASEGHSFWLRLFSNVETTYQAASYTRFREGWERGFSDKGMVLHRQKIADNVQISRVFVINAADELEKLRGTIQIQKDMGVRVKYIEMAALKKLRIMSENFRRFGTYDFAILDHTHVFKVSLDRQRRWTQLELTSDEGTLALAKQLYDDMWEEATDI